MPRLRVIGVMGSGTEEHRERSEPLGRWLATLGVHLLTGGGGGVMAAVSRAFSAVEARRGLVIGIVPSDADAALPKPGYPNAWVEVPIFTHLPLSGARGTDAGSRNHINVLSSDVLIALPGGEGTASEVLLAQRYARPLVAFVADPSEISGIGPEVRIERDLGGVQSFVLSALHEARRRSHARSHRA
jgi:uncharacterized protein (TIGR00725 family)